MLYVSFSEPEAQIRQAAAGIGLDLRGVAFLDLSPASDFFEDVETYDLFSPADIERVPLTRRIVEAVQQTGPRRVFIDSLTQLRYLSPDPFHFHKQALSFLRFLTEQGATVLATSEGTTEAPDGDLQFLSDAVLHLTTTRGGRYLDVSKLRGSDFRRGPHAMRLSAEGMVVAPRLVPEEHRRAFSLERLSTGVSGLDALLHGGIERGTVSIITGPTGVGKTTLGAQFVTAAAAAGHRAMLYAFEEEIEILLSRCEAVNIPARALIAQGLLRIMKIEPLQYSPDEFAHLVRDEVEHHGARVVMIDSISGYQLSLDGNNLITHLHALCKYLQNTGTTTLLINEKENIAGNFTATEVGISYLSDNILYLRYMERHTGGRVELRRAVGILKKRLSDFDKTLREFEITASGLLVHRPMEGLRSILQGLPAWVDPERVPPDN